MPYERYIFTAEQRQYIVDNWGIESAHSMKNKFGCTWYAVVKVAEENGLNAPESEQWTEEDIKSLIELADKFHYYEVAKILERTPLAVYLKAKRSNITLIQDRREWTTEEEETLKEFWGYKSIEVLAKNLKRSVFSLKVKAARMKLGPMIRNNSELLTVFDICDLLQVTRDRVTITWPKLGLNLKTKKVTNNRSYYVITWEDLIDFLKNNQDEWDSRLIEPYMLGNEVEWLLNKRKKDRDENPTFYRLWSDTDKQRAQFLNSIGKSHKEIATELNRSEEAVRHMLNLLYIEKRDSYKQAREEAAQFVLKKTLNKPNL